MAIETLNDYLAAPKQRITLLKTASRTGLVATAESVFDQNGNPGAGTLAGTSTTAGVVPTDATAGCPTINAFGSGAVGYISKVDYGNSVSSRLVLYDMLFKAGAYTYSAQTTGLSAQPSYSGRLPGGSYLGVEIWMEVTTAFTTGNGWTLQVTYTNQSGSQVNTVLVGTFTAANLIVGRMVQLPLAPGDTGVQSIDQIIVVNGGTAMTAGAFNILVMRRLWTARVSGANGGGKDDLLSTGMPEIFADSALVPVVIADSTATGIFELNVEIVNG